MLLVLSRWSTNPGVLQYGTVPYSGTARVAFGGVTRRDRDHTLSSRDTPDRFTRWLQSHLGPDAPRGSDALVASRNLLGLLSNPQDRVPSIHIVGSAGKGSVATLVTGGLVAGGATVATHVSPHVNDVRERFLVDGQLPGWDLVLEASHEVEAASAAASEMGPRPTFFAVTAAMCAVIGRLMESDFLVVEAGIGGRVDATNAFSRSDVLTVVTPIGLEHTDVLGPTVEDIAHEKCAVLTGRRDVVIAPQPSSSLDHLVAEEARGFGLMIHEVSGPDGRTDWRAVVGQTAQAALDVLGARTGTAYSADGLALPPGRFERVTISDRELILDGAHNPMKLAALAATLAAEGINPAVVVAAVGAGKDLDGCASEMARMAPTVVATTFGMGEDAARRGHTARELGEALRRAGVSRVSERSSTTEAVVSAVDTTAPGDTIVITGSFFHLAEARDAMEFRPA